MTQPEPPYFSFTDDPPALDRRPITIKITRPMLMLRLGETAPRHADAGEIITTERHDCENLSDDDYQIVKFDMI